MHHVAAKVLVRCARIQRMHHPSVSSIGISGCRGSGCALVAASLVVPAAAVLSALHC